MTTMTDAELEERAARAMGWRLVDDAPLPPQKPGGPIHWFRFWDKGNGESVGETEWHPLTDAAQAWGVETWLVQQLGQIYVSYNDQGWSINAQFGNVHAPYLEIEADTRARALLLAAVAVGEKGV